MLAMSLQVLDSCLQFDCLYDIFVGFEQGWRSSVGRASDL
jgi:hypothetical protein